MLHQRMSDNIHFSKEDKLNALYSLKDIFSLYKTRRPLSRQIYLSDVSGNDGFLVETDTRKEHFHLFRGRVLSLI